MARPSLGGGANPVPMQFRTGRQLYSQRFSHNYGAGVTLNGARQNAVLLEYDGFYDSDILAYEAPAGLPNINVVIVPIDGGIFGAPGGGDGGSRWILKWSWPWRLARPSSFTKAQAGWKLHPQPHAHR